MYPVYPVIFIDCIHVKVRVEVRDGQVANRPIYVALAVTVEGNRDILGLWAGDGGEGGEGAKYWLQVRTEIKNRGVEDVCMVVCMVVCDGLKGLPDSIGTVWPEAITQTCVVHLLRASFRYAARRGLGQDRHSTETDLYRLDPRSSRGTFPRIQRGMGEEISRDRQAVGISVGRVRAVPAVRCRDPPDGVHDERDRVREREDPQSRPRPGPLP